VTSLEAALRQICSDLSATEDEILQAELETLLHTTREQR
jgi:hypothetical protein